MEISDVFSNQGIIRVIHHPTGHVTHCQLNIWFLKLTMSTWMYLCSKVILLDLSFQIDLKYLTTFPQIGTRVLVNISIEVFKDTKSCINPPLEPTRHVPMGAAPIERGRWDHQKAY